MNPFLNPAFLLRFCIALAYIVLGIVLLMLPLNVSFLDDTGGILFACLLMAYGIFRFYRAFRSLKNEEE